MHTFRWLWASTDRETPGGHLGAFRPRRPVPEAALGGVLRARTAFDGPTCPMSGRPRRMTPIESAEILSAFAAEWVE
jgi:hypothetical protein